MRESKIEKHFKARVAAAGGISLKWVSPGRAGVPDQIVFWPGGYTSVVELKAPNGKLSVLQQLTHQELTDRDHTPLVLASVEAVDAFIDMAAGALSLRDTL